MVKTSLLALVVWSAAAGLVGAQAELFYSTDGPGGPSTPPYAPSPETSCADPSCCPMDGWGPCPGAGRATEFTAGGEFLYWFLAASPNPVPLLTRGTATDPVPGALNQPGTVVLSGGRASDGNPYLGARIQATLFNRNRNVGLEGTAFHVNGNTMSLRGNSDDNGLLVFGRPFFNVLTASPGASLISFPNAFAGAYEIHMDTRFWGADGSAIVGASGRVFDFIYLGFKYLELEDKFRFQEQSRQLVNGNGFFNGQPTLFGDQVLITDRFETENTFYGGQIGAAKVFSYGRGWLYLRGNVALGASNQRLTVAGQSTLIPLANPANTTTLPGGLLALPSNSGTFTKSDFAVVPELRVTGGIRLTDWLTVYGGYSFIYWSSVVRPGDQIDQQIDVRQVPYDPLFQVAPASPQPAVLFRQTDFFAHGFHGGLLLTF